jgi:hypothetical protein
MIQCIGQSFDTVQNFNNYPLVKRLTNPFFSARVVL